MAFSFFLSFFVHPMFTLDLYIVHEALAVWNGEESGNRGGGEGEVTDEAIIKKTCHDHHDIITRRIGGIFSITVINIESEPQAKLGMLSVYPTSVAVGSPVTITASGGTINLKLLLQMGASGTFRQAGHRPYLPAFALFADSVSLS